MRGGESFNSNASLQVLKPCLEMRTSFTDLMLISSTSRTSASKMESISSDANYSPTRPHALSKLHLEVSPSTVPTE